MGGGQGVGDPILLGALIDGHQQLATGLLVDGAAILGIDQVKTLASLPITGTKGHRLHLRFDRILESPAPEKILLRPIKAIAAAQPDKKILTIGVPGLQIWR
jgi:hypothetical protein